MTKLERKIIKLLADFPEREFYSQEIAGKTDCSKASASSILKRLANKGLVFKNVKGHMKFYQINVKNPEFKKFRINSVLEKINPLLPKLRGVSEKIILFGSGSRGEQTFGSDVDLLVLGSDKNKIRVALKKINSKLRINAIVKTPSEWSEMEVTEPEFFNEVKSGIILHENVSRI